MHGNTEVTVPWFIIALRPLMLAFLSFGMSLQGENYPGANLQQNPPKHPLIEKDQIHGNLP
jgi:hypothetical protein